MDPRAYLLNRFEADREALTLRAEQLRLTSTKPGANKPLGPDAAMSRDMAAACDAVVAMVHSVPETAHPTEQIAALSGLIPMLEQLGAQTNLSPPVRSVYVGAATRIREIGAAEDKAHSTLDHGIDEVDDDTDDDIDDDIDNDDADDE